MRIHHSSARRRNGTFEVEVGTRGVSAGCARAESTRPCAGTAHARVADRSAASLLGQGRIEMQTIQTRAAAQPAVTAPRPEPVKPRSPLGRLVLSLAMFVLGLVALIDVSGASMPVSAYFAVPLAVVAAGLVVGAWYGPARTSR